MTFGLIEIAPVLSPNPHIFSWGERRICAEGEYALERFVLKDALPLHFYLKKRGTYFLEEGAVTVRTVLPDGRSVWYQIEKTFSFLPGQPYALYADEPSILYLFSSELEEPRFVEERALSPQNGELLFSSTFDHREKYWGNICSIVSEEFAGKRIYMKKGGQSSLEFHCHKQESYFVERGRLKVGLRFGRAENSSIVLESGQAFTICPGLMHMRIALEDTVLMEISTRDSDSDSYLVEDGRTYTHKE